MRFPGGFRDDRGATAVEYGLIVALIAVVILGAVVVLGGSVGGLFGSAANASTGLTGQGDCVAVIAREVSRDEVLRA